MKSTLNKHLLSFIIPLCAVSCVVHEVREETALPESTPLQFSDSGNAEFPDRWWESFGNGELNALMEEALAGNLDLKTAWARLDQFAALAAIAESGRWPQGSVGADASRSGVKGNHLSTGSGSYGLGFLTSYEIDLWQRIESRRRAAELDWLASRQDLEASALSLSGLIAEQWFFIITQNAQLELLEKQLGVGETFLELNEFRFGQAQAQAPAVSVYQQREQVASIHTQFPMVESSLAVFHNRLSVLSGKPPRSDAPSFQSAFPDLPAAPDTGIPAKALLRRPDIRAAQYRIAAADHRIAAAIAERFPSLRLTAGSSFQGDQMRDVFKNWLWNLASNLAAPVFDGKRRIAEIERNRAVLQERLLSYEKAVLLALQEVENALVRERKQKEYVTALEKQNKLAQTTLDESHARFVNGLSTYLPVLTALVDVQRLERTLLTARRDLYLYRIDLYQALGGSWMAELERPEKILHHRPHPNPLPEGEGIKNTQLHVGD